MCPTTIMTKITFSKTSRAFSFLPASRARFPEELASGYVWQMRSNRTCTPVTAQGLAHTNQIPQQPALPARCLGHLLKHTRLNGPPDGEIGMGQA